MLFKLWKVVVVLVKIFLCTETVKSEIKPMFIYILSILEVDQRFDTSRRPTDPRLLRWNNEMESIFDDDYEGKIK